MYTKDEKLLIRCAVGKQATSFTIPDSVTKIESYAFEAWDSLTSVVIGDRVRTIEGYAFYSCESLTSVYYQGTSEEWNAISISSVNNSCLTNATRYYYSETQPTVTGNWWHYDENGNVIVW